MNHWLILFEWSPVVASWLSYDSTTNRFMPQGESLQYKNPECNICKIDKISRPKFTILFNISTLY